MYTQNNSVVTRPGNRVPLTAFKELFQTHTFGDILDLEALSQLSAMKIKNVYKNALC